MSSKCTVLQLGTGVPSCLFSVEHTFLNRTGEVLTQPILKRGADRNPRRLSTRQELRKWNSRGGDLLFRTAGQRSSASRPGAVQSWR